MTDIKTPPTVGAVIDPVSKPVPPVAVTKAPPVKVTLRPAITVGGAPKPAGAVGSVAKEVVRRQPIKVRQQDEELPNTIFGYGDSGLGKSSQAVDFAKWMYERYGKPLGLLTAETSSQKVFEGAIKAGIVRPFFLPSAYIPLAAMRKVSRGFWPAGAEDDTKWIEPDFCGYIGEGLTSIAQTLLAECQDEGRLMREQKGDAWEVGDETFTPASQSAYGFVQGEVIRAVRGIAGIKTMKRALWTAHEGLTKTKLLCAPALVGSAVTADMPKHCGLLLHFENYPGQITLVEGEEKFKAAAMKIRVWFRTHYDDKNAGLQYLAKTTIPAARLPELYAKYPNGYYDATPTNLGLYDFLTLEEKLMAGAGDEMAKWKAEADAASAAKGAK